MDLDRKIIKPIIAGIINKPVTNDWDIYDKDQENGLYLVHYNQNGNMEEFGDIRGIVVDVYNKIIICASYGFTKGIMTNELKDVSDEQNIKDTNGNDYLFKNDDYKFYIGREGVNVRIFLYNGKIYYSTHRKLNIKNTTSRWGSTTTFWNMLVNLNVPKKEIFFPDETKLYSPYVYIMMITHPDVLHVSKELIDNGYLTHLETLKLWDDSPFTKDIVYDVEPKLPNLTNDLEMAKKLTHVYSPTELTITEVNDHLKYGYSDNKVSYEDNRLSHGEYIVGIKKDNKTWPIDCIRIQSEAYTWRLDIRGDGLNPYRQYLILLNSSKIDATIDKGLVQFKNKYPLLNIYNVNSIIRVLTNNNIIKDWKYDNTNNTPILTPECRMYIIWACYIIASPYHLQKKISKMYNKYLNDITKLNDFMFKSYKNRNLLNIHSNNIIYKIKIYIKSKSSNTYNRYDYNVLMKNAINTELKIIPGETIYRLIKEMNTKND